MFVAFRLKPGRDDDLIAWINTLGEDERSAGIRQALRGNVSRPEVETFPRRHVMETFPEREKIEPKQIEPSARQVDIEANLDGWL